MPNDVQQHTTQQQKHPKLVCVAFCRAAAAACCVELLVAATQSLQSTN